ncbi:hypothetical protein PanWU01x14_231180 [Parasponia andersonii]|uniref:Uncharacterized protein n=1 Tax=Parasponia andersonii TaxID=3476 RepID=A0A2P5BKF1_PARAD|nr:hypothetical protein PanWU01x14_231180 [Parasponia andersonii]
MNTLPNITPPQNGARLSRTRVYMIIGSDPILKHPTKELNGKRGKLILGKRGYYRAPSRGGLQWGFVENPARANG